jgi:hypothetical protein
MITTRGLLASSTALLFASIAVPASAQEAETAAAADAPDDSGDIVVTAQFRGQRLQDPPSTKR